MFYKHLFNVLRLNNITSKHTKRKHSETLLLLLAIISLSACNAESDSSEKAHDIRFAHKNITVVFDANMHSQIVVNNDTALGPLNASEYVYLLDNSKLTDFSIVSSSKAPVVEDLGEGTQFIITGTASNGLTKQVSIKAFEQYPNALVYNVTYTNNSSTTIKIAKWVNNNYQIDAINDGSLISIDNGNAPHFWSFQGASYSDRRDWVMPLKPGYAQQNYMGMNASDYGSGTPISDVWRPDYGMAVGHLALDPELVSIPVTYPEQFSAASLHIELEESFALKPNESKQTLTTFVSTHSGDYYATLKMYRNMMSDKGLVQATVPDSAYETIWCAWGYDRNFSVEEVLNTLPAVKEMGLEWAVIDDGWQTSEGDWYLHPDKFPKGDADMQDLVNKIEQAGLKSKLWWAPLAVDPGTDLHTNHADMLLLNEDGSTQDITWWDSYYLCPAYEGTLKYTKDLVTKMIKTWGYSGLKIDGQHLNGVPPCYNPAHNHDDPQDSVKALNDFWKMVYDTAVELNSEAVVEICPCGTSYAFHNLPYMNQAVSSDPLNSWQVRHKGKTLKGLMGESAPYYGDHVELSSNANDFASSVGIGAIVGTKFTIDSGSEASKQFVLNNSQQAEWKKWIGVYQDKMLPKGTYRGELYDIGFDKPETHAIAKNGSMFYAFYAPVFSGEVTFRGLDSNTQYTVVDYINNKTLGTVKGPQAVYDLSFEQYSLLELRPK